MNVKNSSTNIFEDFILFFGKKTNFFSIFFIKCSDLYETTFCPSIPSCVKWLYLKVHMLPMKEKKCISRC
jgi:hypothetical protein